MTYKFDCSTLPFNLDPRVCLFFEDAITRTPGCKDVMSTIPVHIEGACSNYLRASFTIDDVEICLYELSYGLLENGNQVELLSVYYELPEKEGEYGKRKLKSHLPDITNIYDAFKLIESWLLSELNNGEGIQYTYDLKL